jgi:hypothetical protein
MENWLIDELLDLEAELQDMRFNVDDKEKKAEIRNLLTPVTNLIDEHKHDRPQDFDSEACLVLQLTRARINKMKVSVIAEEEIIPGPPDTLKSVMDFKND